MSKANGKGKSERQVRLVPTAELRPYERNARTHSEAQIAQVMASIGEFGWTVPVLIDPDNGVIAGHARVEAAKRLEMREVPCIVLAGLTEAQKRAYVIADNKLALNAGWDEELLRLELLDLKGMDFGLDMLGFDASELADITLGKDVDQPEYTEAVANDVKMVTCPQCGHSFPR